MTVEATWNHNAFIIVHKVHYSSITQTDNNNLFLHVYNSVLLQCQVNLTLSTIRRNNNPSKWRPSACWTVNRNQQRRL